MNDGRAQLLKQIFQKAVELTGDSPEEFLVERCRGDAKLRGEVDALLGADGRVCERFLQGSVRSDDPALPRRIGRFEIVRRIGHGEMGAVWNVHSGTRAAALSLGRPAWVAFSPDDTRLVSSDPSGLCLWETSSWQAVHRLPGKGLLRFSPDGRLPAVRPPGPGVRLVDATTCEEVAVFEPPETYQTVDLTFSPDGAWLAQFTNRAGVVHLWDLRRIRAELALLGLDWDHPPYTSPDSARSGSVTEVVFDLGELGAAHRSESTSISAPGNP